MALLGLLAVGGVAAVIVRGQRQKKKALAAAAALEAEQAKRLQLAAGDTTRRGELALTDGAHPATADGVVVSLSGPAELPPATPQTHAMALALANPQRAAMVLEAWIDEDDVSQMSLPSAKPEEQRV
jgi:1-deoxy-D-xylulose 5-phosphate reductoisomerase